MSNPPAQPAKRSLVIPEGEKPQSKRRIRSCEACRRLKTRCEIQGMATVCHRCKVLKLECSLEGSQAPYPESPKEPRSPGHQPCDCSEKLMAVENSINQMRDLLEKRLPEVDISSPQSQKRLSHSSIDVKSPILLSPSIPGASVAADRNARTAPANLIRGMNRNLLGAESENHDNDFAEDIIAKGIISEMKTEELAKGFMLLSRRWLFLSFNDPMTIRLTSPLLFASCILAGLHINPSLHGSEVHKALYGHVSSLLSKSTLLSPLPLESIQAMFIFSMWNLVPNKDTEHIDTWLLSGTAAMHGMLSINFEKLEQETKNRKVDKKLRESIRTWNLICLIHLQFSVGTGRPPIIGDQYLKQCQSILNLPSFDSRDKMVAAGVELYHLVCKILNDDHVQTESVEFTKIAEWRESVDAIFNLESSKPLRFAYSCSYLILSRRSIKYLSELHPVDSPSLHSNNSHDFTRIAITHAHTLLTLFVALSQDTSYVRPAYENLLCSYAMVTLSEFASLLDNVRKTRELMEQAFNHLKRGGKVQPVSWWALEILKKYDDAGERERVVAMNMAHGNSQQHLQGRQMKLEGSEGNGYTNMHHTEVPMHQVHGYDIGALQHDGNSGIGIANLNAVAGGMEMGIPDIDMSMWGPEPEGFPSLDDLFTSPSWEGQ